MGVEQLTDHLIVPWGFDFLNTHTMVITERRGNMHLFRLKGAKLTQLQGVPKVLVSGQGGLLDVAAHPQHSKNRLIYFTHAASYKDGNTTQLAIAKVKGARLVNVKTLFTAEPPGYSSVHFGSRIAFDGKGHIFVSIGDRGDRHRAQRLDNHSGKIIRLELDGRVPKDNPFYGRKGAKKEIWTYGHRNPQGLARHPFTGDIWEQEHGPRGGDEINILRKGVNYGWPAITYGREYSGPKISGTHRKGMAQPLHHFTPSIAPSGLSIYGGDRFPNWRGHVFSGALALTHLNRLVFNKKLKMIGEERLLGDWQQRVRNVKTGPDGLIYFSTDTGGLFRLVPLSK